MRAFHNNPTIKAQHLARLGAQHAAGEIVQNQFDCSNNVPYELELGIPWNVAWLQDDIFETLPEHFAPAFVLRFLEVIPVGTDLSGVYDQWCLWMLTNPIHGLVPISDKPSVKQMGELFARAVAGDPPTPKAWASTANLAWATWEARAALGQQTGLGLEAGWDAKAAWGAWANRGAWGSKRGDARPAWAAWQVRTHHNTKGLPRPWGSQAADAIDAFPLAARDELLRLLMFSS
jgi:hypothetical protein